jgi:hypothetical protein
MTKRILGKYILRRWVEDSDCQHEDHNEFDCPGFDTMAGYALLEDTKTRKRSYSFINMLSDGDFSANVPKEGSEIEYYKKDALDDLFIAINEDLELEEGKEFKISREEFDKAKTVYEDVSDRDMRAAFPTLELIEHALESGPRQWINDSWWLQS